MESFKRLVLSTLFLLYCMGAKDAHALWGSSTKSAGDEATMAAQALLDQAKAFEVEGDESNKAAQQALMAVEKCEKAYDITYTRADKTTYTMKNVSIQSASSDGSGALPPNAVAKDTGTCMNAEDLNKKADAAKVTMQSAIGSYEKCMATADQAGQSADAGKGQVGSAADGEKKQCIAVTVAATLVTFVIKMCATTAAATAGLATPATCHAAVAAATIAATSTCYMAVNPAEDGANAELEQMVATAETQKQSCEKKKEDTEAAMGGVLTLAQAGLAQTVDPNATETVNTSGTSTTAGNGQPGVYTPPAGSSELNYTAGTGSSTGAPANGASVTPTPVAANSTTPNADSTVGGALSMPTLANASSGDAEVNLSAQRDIASEPATFSFDLPQAPCAPTDTECLKKLGLSKVAANAALAAAGIDPASTRRITYNSLNAFNAYGSAMKLFPQGSLVYSGCIGEGENQGCRLRSLAIAEQERRRRNASLKSLADR